MAPETDEPGVYEQSSVRYPYKVYYEVVGGRGVDRAHSRHPPPAVADLAANWGMVMAFGKVGEPANRDRLAIWFGGVRVAHKGERDPTYDEAAVSALMQKPEITLKVARGMGKGRDRALTYDLTKEYVAINRDYRS